MVSNKRIRRRPPPRGDPGGGLRASLAFRGRAVGMGAPRRESEGEGDEQLHGGLRSRGRLGGNTAASPDAPAVTRQWRAGRPRTLGPSEAAPDRVSPKPLAGVTGPSASLMPTAQEARSRFHGNISSRAGPSTDSVCSARA